MPSEAHDGNYEREHCAQNDGELEDGKCPVFERERVSELDQSTGFGTREAEGCGQGIEGRCAMICHLSCPYFDEAFSAVYQRVTS